MGKKLDTAKGKAKGVAFGKWAKIDRAQRNMFISVCVASLILGLTFVAIVYFAKVISFNAKLISEKDVIIKDYKTIQGNLEGLSERVNELTGNENLEVVARERADDCVSAAASSITDENAIEKIEVARTCTALRVIPDALPSSGNQEATLASMDQIISWVNGVSLVSLSGADVDEVSFVDEDEENDEESEDSDESGGSSLQALGASVGITGPESSVKKALETIEGSIRNFDIASAQISWSSDESVGKGTIELNATYRAYYSGKVTIDSKSKKVCADNKSSKCTGRKN